MHHLSRHLAGRLGWEGITSNTLACGMYFFSPSDRIPDLTRLSFQARSIPRVNHFIMTVILMLTVCFQLVMAHTLEQFGDYIKSGTPLQRIGTPEDIVGATLYLTSRAGAWVNGATITIDGGATVAMRNQWTSSKL